MQAARMLLEKGEISPDVVLIADEMYLMQGTQFHSGKYIGGNENG